jgi:hypothetical protein
MGRITLLPGTWSNVAGILLAGVGALTAVTATQTSQQVVGFMGIAVGVGLFLSGTLYKGVPLGVIMRGKRARQIAYAERSEFENEVVCVNDLVNDAVPAVVGKQFKRCIIRGPARLWFEGHLSLLFPLASESPLVRIPDGADMTGAVRFIDVVFDRCFFEDLFMELDPARYDALAPDFCLHSRAEWKRFRNYKGPRK